MKVVDLPHQFFKNKLPQEAVMSNAKWCTKTVIFFFLIQRLLELSYQSALHGIDSW